MIDIPDIFNVGTPRPIDSRMVKSTLADRDRIPTTLLYDGLECWVVGEQKKFRYQQGEWVEVVVNAKVDDKKIYQHFVEIHSPDFLLSGRFIWIDDDSTSFSEHNLNQLHQKTSGVLIPTTEAGSENTEYDYLQMTGVSFQENSINWYFHDYRKPCTEYSSSELKLSCNNYKIVKDEVVEIGSIAYSGGITIEDVRRMCNIVLDESTSYTNESNSWEILE